MQGRAGCGYHSNEIPRYRMLQFSPSQTLVKQEESKAHGWRRGNVNFANRFSDSVSKYTVASVALLQAAVSQLRSWGCD